MTDRYRYAAFDMANGATRVYDTRRRAAYDVGRPAGYRLAAVGGGQLLWAGPGAGQVPSLLLFDLAARRVHAPAGLDSFPSGNGFYDGVYFDRVGRWGLSGKVYGYHFSYRVRFNWHTGAFAFGYDGPPADVTEDLDNPGLLRRVCTPLRLAFRAHGKSGTPRAIPFAYDRPYGIAAAGPHGHRLELRRCGSRYRRVLSRTCSYPCRFSLGGGVVSWLEHMSVGRRGANSEWEGRVFAFDIRSGERRSWPPLMGPSTPRVAHTSRHLFVSTVGARGLRGDDPFPFTIRVGRIGSG
jgi:hypothetical protein